MNRLLRIFRTFWALYGALVFMLEVVVYAPLLLIYSSAAGPNRLARFLRNSYYYIPRIHFFPCLIRLRIIGQEKIDPSKQYVIVSNHQSIVDIFANPGASPVFFKYLSKAEVRQMPILGHLASHFCVFVDRKDNESRKQSYRNMKKAIEDGYSILIYPEGTRNRTTEPLKKFYDGAFRLAIDTQTPIAIQTLVGSSNVGSPHYALDLSPGTIHCYWDDPIETSAYTLHEIESLKDRVRAVMRNHLER